MKVTLEGYACILPVHGLGFLGAVSVSVVDPGNVYMKFFR
jgi:hypothetical protein